MVWDYAEESDDGYRKGGSIRSSGRWEGGHNPYSEALTIANNLRVLIPSIPYTEIKGTRTYYETQYHKVIVKLVEGQQPLNKVCQVDKNNDFVFNDDNNYSAILLAESMKRHMMDKNERMIVWSFRGYVIDTCWDDWFMEYVENF
jgi:hypothetical protein